MSEMIQYGMVDDTDVVAFVTYWALKNTGNKTLDMDATRTRDYFQPHLFADGPAEHKLTVDAMSREAAEAWYRVGSCPQTGGLYTDFKDEPGLAPHRYNNLRGYCLEECCGCKICEDYYGGLEASNQSFVLAEMEAFCKKHERSCMNGECSMCGPCFEQCSYDETQIESEAKALLSFVSAAKEPGVTICKMCCHMDMDATATTSGGMEKCPEVFKEKARDNTCEQGHTWDFEVSCTCETDYWLEKKGDTSVMPAWDEESQEIAEFCQNAVTYWVSVYHCNDVYSSLSRDQPAFLVTAASAGLLDEIDLVPTPERPAPSLCDICGATCAFNFNGACQCALHSGPPPDEKYAMFIFCGLIGGLLFIQFYDVCIGKPVA
jgi:hypothetical protein